MHQIGLVLPLCVTMADATKFHYLRFLLPVLQRLYNGRYSLVGAGLLSSGTVRAFIESRVAKGACMKASSRTVRQLVLKRQGT